MKKGSILHGKVKVVHTGTKFVVTLPEKILTTDQYLDAIQAHFWRGFWYALLAKLAKSEVDTEGYPLNTYQDNADFQFAISLAYYQNAVTLA